MLVRRSSAGAGVVEGFPGVGAITGASVGLVGTRVEGDSGVLVRRSSTGAGVSAGVSVLSTGRLDGVLVRRNSTGNGVGEDGHTHSHSVGLDVGARGRSSTGTFVCFGINAFGLLLGALGFLLLSLLLLALLLLGFGPLLHDGAFLCLGINAFGLLLGAVGFLLLCSLGPLLRDEALDRTKLILKTVARATMDTNL